MANVEITFGARLGGVEETVERAQFAEELGYDFVSSGEHFMSGHTSGAHTILPVLAVAAGATKRIRLLSAILFFPMYHPTMVAKLTTTLDIASGGRLTLGVGVGGEVPTDFASLGLSPKDRGARTDEGLALLRRLYTEEHVTHTGRFFPLEDITLKPPSIQKPHPPIWVAGRRDAAMRRAARYGDGWLPYFYNPERYRNGVAKIKEEAAAVDRDISHFQWGYYSFIAITDTVEEGARVAGQRLVQSYRTGRDPEYIAREYAVFGPPEACIKRIQEYIDAGAQHIALNWVCEPKDVRENMTIAAKKILPYFKG